MNVMNIFNLYIYSGWGFGGLLVREMCVFVVVGLEEGGGWLEGGMLGGGWL